jgi:hypothetical protein
MTPPRRGPRGLCLDLLQVQGSLCPGNVVMRPVVSRGPVSAGQGLKGPVVSPDPAHLPPQVKSLQDFPCHVGHRVHTDWRRSLSGVHSIMMEKLAQAGEGGGCTPNPFHYIFHHVQSCSVRSS